MTRRRVIGAELLRVSGRAKPLLERAALARVGAFVLSRVAPDGGFRGRGGLTGDVYYSLFGAVVGSLVGAAVERRALGAFLDRQDPAALDLPHLAALVQCQRLLHLFGIPRRQRAVYLEAVSSFRSQDGGFGDAPGSVRGSAYALYLAVLCHEVLGVDVPALESAVAAAAGLLQAERASATGSLPRLVSATLALQALGGPVPEAQVCAQIRGCCDPAGGCRAHPQAPLCDLLSTAVAAFALRRLSAPLSGLAAARTAQFVQARWDVSGGFCGTAVDPTPDCEYTFYGLLALGALEP
jgi:geranylgeranyl transferase type-2 subunit beta